jgi:hypothetical protein
LGLLAKWLPEPGGHATWSRSVSTRNGEPFAARFRARILDLR